MKTEDLIAMLSTNVEQVDHRSLNRKIAAATVIGAVTAIGLVVFALGPRPDLMHAGALAVLLSKLLFAAIILIPATLLLARFARPANGRKTSIALLALPFLAITALGALSLSFSPSSHWSHLVLGDQWLECLLSIPIIAVVPFAIVIWAVRQMAPTDLRTAGALAGLVAGTLSAIGYALHCVDDSVAFVALWYGGTIALCTLGGAMLGPRLLRW
jgi:hypothetical protein